MHYRKGPGRRAAPDMTRHGIRYEMVYFRYESIPRWREVYGIGCLYIGTVSYTTAAPITNAPQPQPRNIPPSSASMRYAWLRLPPGIRLTSARVMPIYGPTPTNFRRAQCRQNYLRQPPTVGRVAAGTKQEQPRKAHIRPCHTQPSLPPYHEKQPPPERSRMNS